jgi:Na+/H+ antiporter NhaD/arsenite permease-like protein
MRSAAWERGAFRTLRGLGWGPGTTILGCIAGEAVGRARGRRNRLLVSSSVIAALVGACLSATGVQTDLSLVVVWMSGLASLVVDNIAHAISVVPLVGELAGIDVDPLSWAVALGANLGVTTTVVSASAIVVMTSTREARGHRMTLLGSVRGGLPRAVAKMIVGETDIWLRYQVLLS